MGNYHNIESEFIERTMRLISQYDEILEKYSFEEQYNYTLTINCLLGLIVMPKEKVVTFIPKTRLTDDYRKEIGLELSEIPPEIKTLQDLINGLRHSIAHFDINVISEDDKNHIDFIEFKNMQNENHLVAKINAKELQPFLKYYSNCLLKNLEKHRN